MALTLFTPYSYGWLLCTLVAIGVLQWSSKTNVVLAQIDRSFRNMQPEDPFDSSILYPDSENTMDDIFGSDKRSWYGSLYKRRGQQCGNKLCNGKCCGRINPQCCKRGWSCRYMPRTRNFVCIP